MNGGTLQKMALGGNNFQFCILSMMCTAAAISLSAPTGAAHAQGFGASISPPRVELQIRSGQTKREVIEIQQSATSSGAFRIYTNDWAFQPDGSLAFTNDLAPGSCRPWVSVERRQLTIAANARYRYRFEISPPAGTPQRECRFAIMVEGTDPAQVESTGLSIPVGGRIAVIVYASIDGAAPRLEFGATRVSTVNGQWLPTLEVRNTGNAHGRLEGFLNGTDATGATYELAPANLPILPGESRTISMLPVTDDPKGPAAINYPLAIKGTLEWGAERFPLAHTFTR
ncbi:MAG: hypothetical protein JWP47_2137 [Polaromonas sp.]|jgi:hypothetical protein|nr:hypothetical protein [Polaromonas sp.]